MAVNQAITDYVTAHPSCTFDMVVMAVMEGDDRSSAEGTFRAVLDGGLIVKTGTTALGDQDIYGVP